MSGPPTYEATTVQAFLQLASSGTTFTPLTTTKADAVIIALVYSTGDAAGSVPNFATAVSITGGSLTFQKYASRGLTGIGYNQATTVPPTFNYQGIGGASVEIWWAHAPTLLSGVHFTLTMSGGAGFSGMALIAVDGCANPAAPWDTNGTLPASAASVSGTVGTTISTTSPNDLILVATFIGLNATVFGDPFEPPATTTLVPLTFSESFGGPTNGGPLNPGSNGYIAFDVHTWGGPEALPQTSLAISGTASSPLAGLVFVIGVLVGVPAVPPPTPAVLNMDNVVVTSLAAESPCTALQYVTPPPSTAVPAIGLRWSDTRGATFGNAVPQALGSDPLTQLQWNRTGYARDRVFELFWSAAAKTALNGAFVIIEPWRS